MTSKDGTRHTMTTTHEFDSTSHVDDIVAANSPATPALRVIIPNRKEERDAEHEARRTLRREKAFDRARGILPLLLHKPGAEARILIEVVTLLSNALGADGCDLLRVHFDGTSTLYRVSGGTLAHGTSSAKPDSALRTGAKISSRHGRNSSHFDRASPSSPIVPPVCREVVTVAIARDALALDVLRQDGMTSLHTFIRSPDGSEPLGMLSAHTIKGTCFSPDDVALLDVVADLLGATLADDFSATADRAMRLEEVPQVRGAETLPSSARLDAI